MLVLVFVPVLLSAPVRAADAQTLPLQFARASARVERQFTQDWQQLSGAGKEWAYCITKWSIGYTQDRDTVYIAEQVERMTGDDADAHSVYAGCMDPHTQTPLPMAHSHPSGDCSPSRADITLAITRTTAPFELIVCGPTSTVGYMGSLYRKLVAFPP